MLTICSNRLVLADDPLAQVRLQLFGFSPGLRRIQLSCSGAPCSLSPLTPDPIGTSSRLDMPEQLSNAKVVNAGIDA